MMKRRARISVSPAATVRASVNLASAAMTRAPSASSRAAESAGARPPITCCRWSCSLRKLTFGSSAVMPKGAPERTAWA
jgi:hypothetical protein